MKAERFLEETYTMQSTPPAQELAMTVSVVMVSYYTGPVLWRAIESVLKQHHLHELIIVDNGNPPDIQERLSALAKSNPSIIYLSGHGNIGFARACNKGSKQATGYYLLMLNPDCVLSPNTLERTINIFKNHPKTWVAGCCLVNPDYSEQGSSRRNILTPATALIETFRLYHILPRRFSRMRLNFHQSSAVSNAYFVPAISGAFMFMVRETYTKLGGIDEGYFLHVEDLDFCLQVNEHGGKILYIPDVKVVHYHRTSSVSTLFVERHKARGFIRYFKKNFDNAYFPGILLALYAAVYARLGLRAMLSILQTCNPKRLFPSNTEALLESHRIALLKSYAQPQYQAEEQDVPSLDAATPILLTGATGQVGLCILRRLLAAGVKVTCVYHSNVVDFTHPNLSWLQADLKQSLLDLEEHAPKTVIHTASIWLLPKHIETLANAGVKRVIAFGSTAIFGKAHSNNHYEQAMVERFNRAERAIAALCARHGIEWSIIRPTNTYGAGLDRSITNIAHFIKRFHCFPIYGKGQEISRPVHADDLAKATVSIISNPVTYNKSYNLCGEETLTYYDIVQRIFTTLDKKPVIIRTGFLSKLFGISGNKAVAKRTNINLATDDSEARQDFFYCPRPFLNGGLEDIEPCFQNKE